MNALLMAVALAILGMVFMLAPNDGGPANHADAAAGGPRVVHDLPARH